VKPKAALAAGFGEIRDGQLVYLKELPKGQSVFSELEGFGATAKDFDIRVENRKTGAGVRIQGDQPISKIVFWSITSTVCPEPYVDVSVAPGREKRWTYRYTFYDSAQ
jgi:hypothetical protein